MTKRKRKKKSAVKKKLRRMRKHAELNSAVALARIAAEDAQQKAEEALSRVEGTRL